MHRGAGAGRDRTAATEVHVQQLGVDHAGVQEVGADVARVQAARQLAGEQGVGELGVAIRLPAVETAFHLQVGEVDVPAAVHARTDVDDARGRAGAEPVEQQVGQQERRQVVDREGTLVAVGGGAAAAHRDAGVVDQHVEPGTRAQDPFGQCAHFGQRRKVGGHRRHLPVAGGVCDLTRRNAGARLVAPVHDHGAAPLGQRQGGGAPDAVGAPGYQNRLHASEYGMDAKSLSDWPVSGRCEDSVRVGRAGPKAAPLSPVSGRYSHCCARTANGALV